MSEKFHNGYILISRSLQDSNLWQLPPDHFRVALYLLMKARHKTKPHRLPDGLEINRGELVTSMSLIAENCSYYENRVVREMSRKKALNILENLENIGFLRRNSHSKGTHLTICNYDSYQTANNYNLHADETVREQSGNSEGTRRDTNKKVNNDKKEKNEENTPLPPKGGEARKRIEYSPDFEAFWKLYGVGGKKPAFEAWLKQNISPSEQSEILRAVPIYKTYCSENERSLKDGQGWINQRYWETDWNRQPKTKRPERFGPSLEGAI